MVDPPPRSCTNSPRRNTKFARNSNNVRHYEMRTDILQLLYLNPFTSLDHEDPYNHLTKFYEIAGAIGAPESEEEQVFKRLFPHYLIGKAKDWYLDQPTQTMTDWNALEEVEMSLLMKHGRGINQFLGSVQVTVSMKSLIHIFRNGHLPQPKLLLNATAGGSLMEKTAEEEIEIIEKMAWNDLQVQHNRGYSQNKPRLIELGTNAAFLSQNKLLSQQVEELTKQMSRLPQQLKELQELASKHKQVNSCEYEEHQT